MHITEKMFIFVVVFQETVRVGIYSLIIKGNEHENFILFRCAQRLGSVYAGRLPYGRQLPAQERGPDDARECEGTTLRDALGKEGGQV